MNGEKLQQRILGLASQGPGSNDEQRLIDILRGRPMSLFPFHRSTTLAKLFSAVRLLERLSRRDSDLVVLEGTGIAAGGPLLLSRFLGGPPFVVGTGDAIGPFVAGRAPILGPLFSTYERALYRYSAGVIAWTPYLAGRALTFGAPRTVTAPGWAPHPLSPNEASEARRLIRRGLGIPDRSIVIGIVGSLDWNPRYRYCYGAELVRAAVRLRRQDVVFLVVGGGSGLEYLRKESNACPNVLLPGKIPRREVSQYLAAMDIASLPQSRDRVGAFRYSTKLPEYVAAGLPMLTGQLPVAYDLGLDAFFRLPGAAPWSDVYIEALKDLLESLRPEMISKASAAARDLNVMFGLEDQRNRVSALVEDIVAEAR